MSGDVCGDNRFELIEKYKKRLCNNDKSIYKECLAKATGCLKFEEDENDSSTDD